MAQRIAILVACAVLAVLAVISGLDRAATFDPARAQQVPQAFAAQAMIARARQAVLSGQFAQGEALAARAVYAAPIEPESTALLGTAWLARGGEDKADSAFRVAGQFGWRAPITQYYWMRRAVEVGDYRVAAMRLDAMLRQDPGSVANLGLLAPVQTAAPGRTALVERLMADPPWLSNYAQQVYEVPASEAALRAAVFDELAQHGKAPPCDTVAPLINRLIGTAQWTRAVQMWRVHCPARFAGRIADGAFDKLQVHQAVVPFDWSVIGDSDVSLNLEGEGGAGPRSLVVASTASFPRKILAQLVVLPPGTYRLSWGAVARDGTQSGQITAYAGCDGSSRDWRDGTFDPATRRWAILLQVTGECAANWINLAIRPGNDTVLLSRVSLDPL